MQISDVNSDVHSTALKPNTTTMFKTKTGYFLNILVVFIELALYVLI